MRKVVSSLFITLDGIVEEPSDWQETFDAEMGQALTSHIENTDTILLGRVTYEYWNTLWPNTPGDGGFVDYINNTPKYVASTTLDTVEWGAYKNITLIRENLVEAVHELKQQSGENITIAGSPGLVHYLMENEALDELQLLIHPVVANKGKRLFKADSPLQRFHLAECQATSSGTIIASYRLRKTQG